MLIGKRNRKRIESASVGRTSSRRGYRLGNDSGDRGTEEAGGVEAMTEQEYRALDEQIESAMGWFLAEPGYETDEHSIAPLWRNRDGSERVGSPRRYTTDPAACAEVKRWLFAQGWDCLVGSTQDTDVFAKEATPSSAAEIVVSGESSKKLRAGNTFTKRENPNDHNGDPIIAEAVALARATIAAVEATQKAAQGASAEVGGEEAKRGD